MLEFFNLHYNVLLRFDLPCNEIVYYDKNKQRKWNRVPKKTKGSNCTQIKTGSPIEPPAMKLTMCLVNQLKLLNDFITEETSK